MFEAANDDYFELLLGQHERFAHAAARGIEFRASRPKLLFDAA